MIDETETQVQAPTEIDVFTLLEEILVKATHVEECSAVEQPGAPIGEQHPPFSIAIEEPPVVSRLFRLHNS